MNIVVVTSSPLGTASECLPELARSAKCKLVGVVLARGPSLDRLRVVKKKLRKVLQIGVLGAINGVRMRSWYNGPATADIRDLCRELGIPIFETQSTNSVETVRMIQDLQPDLGVSLNNGYIPTRVFGIPKYGMINVHGERLPEYQNAQSVIWPIYHGEMWSGLTIHQIDRQIDSGDILYREEIPIRFCPTLGDTVRKTIELTRSRTPPAVRFVCDNYPGLRAVAEPQQNGRKFTTPTITQFFQMIRNNKRLYNESARPGSVGEQSGRSCLAKPNPLTGLSDAETEPGP